MARCQGERTEKTVVMQGVGQAGYPAWRLHVINSRAAGAPRFTEDAERVTSPCASHPTLVKKGDNRAAVTLGLQ